MCTVDETPSALEHVRSWRIGFHTSCQLSSSPNLTRTACYRSPVIRSRLTSRDRWRSRHQPSTMMGRRAHIHHLMYLHNLRLCRNHRTSVTTRPRPTEQRWFTAPWQRHQSVVHKGRCRGGRHYRRKAFDHDHVEDASGVVFEQLLQILADVLSLWQLMTCRVTREKPRQGGVWSLCRDQEGMKVGREDSDVPKV